MKKLLSPEQASSIMRTSPAEVERMIAEEKIDAYELDGRHYITEADANAAITRGKFSHLDGRPITATQAREKYSIAYTTLKQWVAGNRIKRLSEGYRKTVTIQAGVGWRCTPGG